MPERSFSSFPFHYSSIPDHAPSTLAKLKPKKFPYNHLRIHSSLSKLTLWSSFFLSVLSPSPPSASPHRRSLNDSWDSSYWKKCVAMSARHSSPSNLSLLVTRVIAFVGSHVSLSLKRCGDDIFNLNKDVTRKKKEKSKAKKIWQTNLIHTYF